MADIETNSLPSATAADTAAEVLGRVGGALKWFPVQSTGFVGKTNVNASRVIAPSDVNGGRLIVTSSAATILTLPTWWRLGITFSNSLDPVLAFERQGLGALFVTPALYRGSVANQAAMLALSASIEDYCWRSDALAGTGQMFVLTALPATTAGNWTAVPAGAANRPVIPTAPDVGVTINWGSDSRYDPQYLEADVTVQLTGKSQDHWKAG